MMTVGQILKKKRLEKEISLEDISKYTKIQVKYLEALERDDYQLLPSSITARGFIKLFGSALGLPSQTLLALFRRDFTEDKSGQIIPRGVVKPLSEPGFVWSPRHTIVTGAVFIVTLLGFYLYREYQILAGPPKLEIVSPKQNAEVLGVNVEVRGEVDPESKLSINSETVDVESNGTFSLRLSLPPGENILNFEAKDIRGKINSIERKIQVVPQ